jgi:hypothetical protein
MSEKSRSNLRVMLRLGDFVAVVNEGTGRNTGRRRTCAPFAQAVQRLGQDPALLRESGRYGFARWAKIRSRTPFGSGIE